MTLQSRCRFVYALCGEKQRAGEYQATAMLQGIQSVSGANRAGMRAVVRGGKQRGKAVGTQQRGKSSRRAVGQATMRRPPLPSLTNSGRDQTKRKTSTENKHVVVAGDHALSWLPAYPCFASGVTFARRCSYRSPVATLRGCLQRHGPSEPQNIYPTRNSFT